MAEISIGSNHQATLARIEHVGEFLQGEQHRLQLEAAHVAQQIARLNAELGAFLLSAYGLDLRQVPVTVDTARGVLITPDPLPDAATAAAPTEPS